MDELLNELVEETRGEIYKLKDLQLGKDEHSKAVEDIAKLYKLAHDEEKLAWESDKYYQDVEREKLKYEQEATIRQENFDHDDNVREIEHEHDMALKKIEVEREDIRLEQEAKIERNKNLKDIGVFVGGALITAITTGVKIATYKSMHYSDLDFERTGTFSATAGREHMKLFTRFLDNK